MEDKLTIEFTKEETNALAELLDIAVKAGGLRVASAAIVIMQKLQEAAKKAEEDTANGN